MHRVDGVSDLHDWAESKTCKQWRQDRSCGHGPCVQAQRAVDVLSQLSSQGDGVWTLKEADVRFTAE